MEKLINNVGLSWLYDQIKFDLINIYNLLNTIDRNDLDNRYKEIDAKICQIAKTFFMLDITGGVFFINEFRLSLKYLVSNAHLNKDKIIAISDNIEQIVNYIEDIIQGYGDLPIYYVTTIDELRAIRHEVLFSQCTYIVNSVKQQNISDYPPEFSINQLDDIKNSLVYLSKNVFNHEQNVDQIIKHIKALKTSFKGTQHYLLWDLLNAYFDLNKNYSHENTYIFKYLLKNILDSYNQSSNSNFEKLAKQTPEWIATISFNLLYSGYFNIIEKDLRFRISKILNIHDKKTLTNYMAFAERMIDTDSWILLLDLASELDIAISNLDESRHKKRIDINWLHQFMQKHIDSCVLSGTYEPLEYYYDAVRTINQYTIAGGLISSDDLELIEQEIVKLAKNVEQSVDQPKRHDNFQDDNYDMWSEQSVAEVNLDAKKSLLQQQISELEEISSYILSESDLTFAYISRHFNKILNILNIINFKPGEQIISLYLKKLEDTVKPDDILSDSLRQNIIVFIKYLTEIIKAIYKNQDYNFHVKSLKNLINNIELAGINNFREGNVAKIKDAPKQTIGNTGSDSSVSLKQIFFEEFEEIYKIITNLVQNWQQDHHNHNIIESLQRELHTLKGASRMVGFMVVSDWIHHIEELLTELSAQSGFITENNILKIKSACTKIHDLIAAFKINVIPSLPESIKLEFQQTTNTTTDGKAKSIDDLSLASLLRAQQEPEAHADEPVKYTSIPLRQNVRVSKDDLDFLLDMACELVIGQHQLSQQNNHFSASASKLKKLIDIIQIKAGKFANNDMGADLEQIRDTIKQLFETRSNYYNIVSNNDNNVNEVFNSLVTLRMVPLSAIKERLTQLVNTIADELNKKINFVINKSEGSIDRVVLEQITPSIEHLIRNAIAHGIEPMQIRARRGKDPIGTLELNMYTDEQTVIIEILDDGHGLDIKKIKERALELGMIDEHAQLTQEDILNIITSPKFSTAESVSQISGRGMGLNVVKKTVAQLCGTLELKTEPNGGTKFIMHLPYSMAKQPLLFISIADLYYAIPSLIVEEVIKVKDSEINISGNSAFYNNMPVYNLYDLLNYDNDKEFNFTDITPGKLTMHNLVIICYKHNKVACIVDEVWESRESVVRPLSKQLRKLTEFMGGTIYQDGRVVLILDLVSILNNAENNFKIKSFTAPTDVYTDEPIVSVHISDAKAAKPWQTVTKRPEDTYNRQNINSADIASTKDDAMDQNRKTTVLVVEDSATVRHAIKNYLSTAHFTIITAVDGLDGLNKLKEIIPDVILLDIVMPNMNGLEFLKNIRKNPQLQGTPVIIMTSREEESYKEVARQLNVDVYIKKPYDQTKLMNAINHVLEV